MKKGGSVTKQSEKLVKNFLTSLATDHELLLEFIKDPDRVLNRHKIRDKATKESIRNLLALEISKKLLVVPAYASSFVHW
jgi:hypothetical protein